MAESWYAVLIAAPGHCLLGGVKKSQSSRFATFEQAAQLRDTSREINEQAGRKVALTLIEPSDRSPEINAAGEVV